MANLDDRDRPIAETYRKVALVAESLALPRPSYERLRALIHEIRARRRDPVLGQVLLDITFRRRAPEALLEVLAGIDPPPLP